MGKNLELRESLATRRISTVDRPDDGAASLKKDDDDDDES